MADKIYLKTEGGKYITTEDGKRIWLWLREAIAPSPETAIHLEEGKFKKK
jgi:hypothetical protein